MNDDTTEREKTAAMAWTRLAEGEDSAAVRLVESVGYARALDMVGRARDGSARELVSRGVDPSRWIGRWDPDQFAHDRERGMALGGFLWPGDSWWPESLNHLGDQKPLGMWYRGSLHALTGPSIAIVGSRAATSYGVRVTHDIACDLAASAITIISGGAFGVDSAAHRGALAADYPTIAVLAGGVDSLYPRANAQMFHSILGHHGIILSENPQKTAPMRHRFLARNRLIAALSGAVVVTEAPFRSGAISTARHALSIGREVGAVPGPVTSPASGGCHRLLREGAICVTNTSEVRELLGYGDVLGSNETGQLPVGEADSARSGAGNLDAPSHTSGAPSIDPISARILDAMPLRTRTTTDSIARAAGIGIQETMRGLGKLELKGMVARTDGLWHMRRR